MRVYIFSLPQNLETARKIQDFLNLKGHSAKLFDSDSQFFISIYKKEEVPDFIIYDYLLFNHNAFNIYNFMKKEDCLVPLVFFNEPTLHPEPTEVFFKNFLNLIHDESKIDWEKYEKIVSDSAEIITQEMSSQEKAKTTESALEENSIPEKNPCTTKSAEQAEKRKDEPILKELSGISIAIFKKLFKNLNKCVPLKELQASEELQKTLQEATVFCSISKIRKAMKKAGSDDFDILKNPRGYTMISRF